MNTILHVTYNAMKAKRKLPLRSLKTIRVRSDADRSQVRFLNGVTEQMRIVHLTNGFDALLDAQQRVVEAVKKYEDRIYKRVPPDIA